MEFTYRGLKAQLDRHIITDEEIDRNLERLRQQNPRIAVIKDRPTELGDEVILDYAGYCDGEQFAGGTAQRQSLVLGSGMFIPGFEEQLVDKVPGEQVIVKVTFPETYHAENLAGKEADFHCVIHEIRVKTPYEMDDVFAQEVGNCESYEQMREKLRESLQAFSDERGEMDLQDRLLRQAASTLELEITEAQMDEAIEAQLQTLNAQLGQRGLDINMYCQFMNTTEEALREEARPAAEASIRAQAIIDKVVELENLQAESEEIAEAMALICRQNNMTMEQLKPLYDAEFEKAVINSVLTSKVMGLIRDTADIAVV